jgi:N-succinyl-L-ornithine transcarbamylase
MNAAGHSVIVTHPQGYDLDEEFMKGHRVSYNQEEAFAHADFVYVKNWSSVRDYGKVLDQSKDWQVTFDKLQLTNKAKLMHCLPVRRNVVISDDAMDSEHSIIYDLAENRLHTAQAVLHQILQTDA